MAASEPPRWFTPPLPSGVSSKRYSRTRHPPPAAATSNSTQKTLPAASRSLKKNCVSLARGFQYSIVPCCGFQARVRSTTRRALSVLRIDQHKVGRIAGGGQSILKHGLQRHEEPAAGVPRHGLHMTDIAEEMVLGPLRELLDLQRHLRRQPRSQPQANEHHLKGHRQLERDSQRPGLLMDRWSVV